MNEMSAAIDIAALRARHAAFFKPDWRRRAIVVGVIVAMTAIYVGAFATFDVPWGRIVPGLRQLGWFVAEMFPPDPGNHLVTYLNALGETLAIALLGTHFGALGKLFAEIIESADRKQLEGVRAAGGRGLAVVRFGLMPQVLPVIAGQILYFIESNTRSATIIGIVGAGGIGLQLAEQIRVLEWQKVSFLILMILIAVAAIDWISSKLRFAIIGRRAVA